MTQLFDQHGVRIFKPSRPGMVGNSQGKTIAQRLQIKKISTDTSVRHYGRLLDIMSEDLAHRPQYPAFRALVDDINNFPDEAEFREGFARLTTQLAGEPLLAPLLQNIGFPFVIPRQPIRHYGRRLLRFFLPLLEASLAQHFSMQDKSHRLIVPSEPSLRARQQHSSYTFIRESRYANLIEALAQHYILAIFFPALPGFSLSAAVQQMNGLPPSLILSGAASTAMAIATWPEHLSKLSLACPAIRYEHDDCSVWFDPNGDSTIFQPTHPNIYTNGLSKVCSGLIYVGNEY